MRGANVSLRDPHLSDDRRARLAAERGALATFRTTVLALAELPDSSWIEGVTYAVIKQKDPFLLEAMIRIIAPHWISHRPSPENGRELLECAIKNSASEAIPMLHQGGCELGEGEKGEALVAVKMGEGVWMYPEMICPNIFQANGAQLDRLARWMFAAPDQKQLGGLKPCHLAKLFALEWSTHDHIRTAISKAAGEAFNDKLVTWWSRVETPGFDESIRLLMEQGWLDTALARSFMTKPDAVGSRLALEFLYDQEVKIMEAKTAPAMSKRQAQRL